MAREYRRKNHSRVTGLLVASTVVLSSWGGRSTSGQDCNLNGTPDGEDVAAGVSEDCNGDLIPDECEATPLSFGSERLPRDSDTARTTALTEGDFDADGDLDLAVGDSLTRSRVRVTLFLNDGAGALAPGPQSWEIEDEVRINALRTGDVDGDGVLDVVFLGNNAPYVLLQGAAEVSTTRVKLPFEENLRAMEVGDVDNDGIDDIILASRLTDELLIVRGNRRAELTRASRFATGDSPRQIALGDFDADGNLDIAVASAGSDDISVHRGTGGGTLTLSGRFSIGTGTPTDLETADFDEDGFTDLAVLTGVDLAVLLNDGQGRFPGISSSLTLPGGSSLATNDFDRDGDLDLAVTATTASGLLVLLGEGDGGLHRSLDFALGEELSSGVSGDFDGDGIPDVAAIATDPELGFSSTNVLVLKSSHRLSRLTVDLERTTFPASFPHWGALEDFDGDGDLDLAASVRKGGGLQLYLNEGDGTFVPGQELPAHFLSSFSAMDIDGDGDVDLAAPQLDTVFLNRGNATFETGGPSFTGLFASGADLDADGNPDVVDTSASIARVHFGRPGGRFEDAVSIRYRGEPSAVTLADLDGDGDGDIALPLLDTSEVVVFLNQGGREFAGPRAYEVRSPSFLAAGDFDGDGDLDLGASTTVGTVLPLLNRGDGTFEPRLPISLVHVPYSVTAADLNRDGLTDLVTANENGNSISLLMSDGSGSFQAPIDLAAGGGLRWVDGGDIDGDGDVDLVTTNRAGASISVFFNREIDARDTHREFVCTATDFQTLSIPSTHGWTIERLTKYIVPARRDDPELLPPLFQNARLFKLHLQFLSEVFPERFGDLTSAEYERLVARRANREYFIGTLYRLRTDAGWLYGFNVLADYDADRRELPRLDEVESVYRTLGAVFTAGPLAYFPTDEITRESATTWVHPAFDVHLEESGSGLEYVAYTSGVGFGRVRLLDEEDFAAVNESGGFSFQDILVLEGAPRDIEGVVSGVITGEPQGELSHLAVRTARRATPNAFVRDALRSFAPFDGELVRLEVREDGYHVEESSPEEARKWWDSNRPRLSTPPVIDPDFSELPTLGEIAALELEDEPPFSEARFGGKAANFARLQAILGGERERYREPGFAIPARYYLDFMRVNRIRSALDPGREVTYEEFLEELLAVEEFRSNPEFRFAVLRDFRRYAREFGVVPPALVRRVALRVAEVFGTTTGRVRFRSSSNVEDALEFNGAGLYDSTSACVADDLDVDESGPSRCDPARDERGIARAMKKVWASLWNFRAYEERAYFAVPQDRAAMAVLVTRAFIDERANGVAFTGNLANPLDRRYVVTVQEGERSVVSPEPGEIAEKNILTVEDGDVVEIVRMLSSSVVPPGTHVLSDEQLGELGALLSHLDEELPVDLRGHERLEVLLDVEFKFEVNGDLAVKQVRPFLISVPLPPTPTFALEVPAGLETCGTFRMFRGPREAYELKSVVRFHSGLLELPTEVSMTRAELFEEVRLGPEQQVAEAQGMGRFRLRRLPGVEVTTYRFDYEQEFALPDGTEFQLRLADLRFGARGEEPTDAVRTLDEEFLTWRMTLQGELDRGGEEAPGVVRYSSCGFQLLPVWNVRVELEDGSRLSFAERLEPELSADATSPASLVRAELEIGGEKRVVEDYWNLVYTASRHNLGVRYWVVLDPALEVPGLEGAVAVVEVAVPDEIFDVAQVSYLDEEFRVITSPAVGSVSREPDRPEVPGGPRYRRGDVDTDGSVNLADATALLGYLFQRAAPPSCAKAADATDDGAINVTDAVAILTHVFGGATLPVPVDECGQDPTPDALRCEAAPICR